MSLYIINLDEKIISRKIMILMLMKKVLWCLSQKGN